VAAVALLAGCNSSHPHPKPTVNATEQAELKQGQLLLAGCFPKTVTEQVRTVHLVFLSSAKGTNGPAVVAARDKLFTCLNINDPAKRQAFVNKAGDDALHGHLATQAGRHAYFTVTLPKDILAAGGHAGGVSGPTANIPGVTGSASPRGTPAPTGSK
jgi:hypothetical protein